MPQELIHHKRRLLHTNTPKGKNWEWFFVRQHPHFGKILSLFESSTTMRAKGCNIMPWHTMQTPQI